MRFTTDELNARVLEILKEVRPTPENRLTKEKISIRIYGRYDPGTDRKIRDAVEELRNYEPPEPIGSSSGKAGYYYGWESIRETISDMRSRGGEIFATANKLEIAMIRYEHEQKVNAIKRSEPVREVVQMGMF